MLIIVLKRRILFIDEYWILVPITVTAIGIKYFLMRKARRKKVTNQSIRDQREEEKQLITQAKIYSIATNNIGLLMFLLGFNEDGYCTVGDGARFIDHEFSMSKIREKFSNRAVRGVIYITEHALCYIVRKYDLLNAVLPNSFRGRVFLTSWVVLAHKLQVMFFMASMATPFLAPSLGILANAPVLYLTELTSFAGLLNAALSAKRAEAGLIPSSLIEQPLAHLKGRLRGLPDVVSVNYEKRNSGKVLLEMFNKKQPPQCMIPGYQFTDKIGLGKNVCDAINFELPDIGWSKEIEQNVVTLADVINLEENSLVKKAVKTYKDRNQIPRKVAKMVTMSDIGLDNMVSDDEIVEIADNAIKTVMKQAQRIRINNL